MIHKKLVSIVVATVIGTLPCAMLFAPISASLSPSRRS